LGETYAGLFRFDDDADVGAGIRMVNVAVPVVFDCEPEPPEADEGEAAGATGAVPVVEPLPGSDEPLPPPPQPTTAIAMIAVKARCKRFISSLCLSRGFG
jgi:hypothetical protein